ncbi:hypothetical protein AVEN_88453-1 [Araneus ventricosus]|uniref:THAP-type domain-containing protein n=1 Tax=Araneus ventricosus TaxID=182803 RepID=A0A4Y2JHB6_ARAVE|nr:hypothetical protein AVEN_88453-1 [Araneus ventricosus]
MGHCVAFNCPNGCSKKIPGLTFHSFPKDETARKLGTLKISSSISSSKGGCQPKQSSNQPIPRQQLEC